MDPDYQPPYPHEIPDELVLELTPEDDDARWLALLRELEDMAGREEVFCDLTGSGSAAYSSRADSVALTPPDTVDDELVF
jgi:hypothetical protein